MNDETIQLLGSYLDDELTDVSQLEARLNAEPALRRELEELRSQRAMREGFFASLEGDDAAVERVIGRINSEIRERESVQPAMSSGRAIGPMTLRWALAAAACLLLGFLAGWLLHGSNARQHANGALAGRAAANHAFQVAPTVYKVAITDEYGNVIDVQKFDSLERARQFADDLDRWQDRLDQLRTGQITVRSASF